jgi:guanylate kinase
MMATNHTGNRKILVFVGAPGVGKKFCSLRLNGNHPMDVEILKTLTTQPQRQIFDSLFYKTVGPEEFQQRVAAGELLEYDEFAGHWYGIERAETETILRQKHAVVSATPQGAETLRQGGSSTVVVYLSAASKHLLEDNLRQKQEAPERLAQMRQTASLFTGLPASAYDIAVRVTSLPEAVRELEEKLPSYLDLH